MPSTSGLVQERRTRTELSPTSPAGLRPHWDGQRRELSVAGVVVKRFRQAADNQEVILETFEAEVWAQGGLSPVTGTARTLARDRLHDAIRRLNANQHEPWRIRFRLNGCGGILWSVKRVGRSHRLGGGNSFTRLNQKSGSHFGKWHSVAHKPGLWAAQRVSR